MMPPQPLASPDYPFQMVVADYCNVKGKSWLVLCDRFSGWLSVQYFPREATAGDLVRILKEYFSIFGIPEHFSSDDGPQFRSETLRSFFKCWGVKEHRVSSAYHPHSNLRAKTAVKSAKRILLDNTRSDGSPDSDKLLRAIMQHRNTPDAEFKLSPAQLVFGRPIKDFLPIKPANFRPSEVWMDCYNKYRIRVDGSGRVTDRNRQFLRQFSSVTPSEPRPSPSSTASQPAQPAQPPPPPVTASTAPDVPAPPPATPVRVPTAPDLPDIPDHPVLPQQPPVEPEVSFFTPPSSPQGPSPSAEPPPPPATRRSGRNVRPNTLFPSQEYDLGRSRPRHQEGGVEARQ